MFVVLVLHMKLTDLVILDLKFELLFGFIDVLQLLLQFRQLVSDLHVMRIVPGEGVDHSLILPSHTNVIVVLHQIRIMHTCGCQIVCIHSTLHGLNAPVNIIPFVTS